MKITEIIKELKKNVNSMVEQLDKEGLKKVLDYLNDHYYNKGESLLSDQLYDVINDYYKNTYGDKDNKENIGHKVDKDGVTLPYYMGSLDKIKPSTTKFDNWVKKYDGPYVVSYKLDGISSMLYKTEKGTYLYTRGNGFEGQNISHTLKYININTKKLKVGDAIRGELIMSKKNFELFSEEIKKEIEKEIKYETKKKIEKETKINNEKKLSDTKLKEIDEEIKKKVGEKMKDPRTAVGGLLRNDKPNAEKLKLVDFVAYDAMNLKEKYSDKLEYIKKLDITTVDYFLKEEITLDYLSKKLIESREKYKYTIDGLVIFDNSKYHKIVSGEKPKYAFAYKQVLTDQLAETTVTSVVWNISKDKYLNPTIYIEPVELLNSKIRKMTGKNAKFIKNNKIGPGAVVEIIKSGDVIPNINKIIKPADSNKPQMPNHDYKWNDSGVGIISTKMTDELMNKTISKKILHFFDAFGIKFIGEGIINKFIKYGYDDLWKILTAKKEDLIGKKGFDKKNIDKIFSNIDKGLTNRKLHEILSASQVLGRGVGEKKLKLITDKYPNIIEIYQNNTKEYVAKLINNILGFNTKTTNKIVDNFDTFIEFYNKLVKLKPNIVEIKKNNNVCDKNNDNENDKNVKSKYNLEKFKGKKIVFTGVRDKNIEEEIENIGGKIITDVSAKTDYVIAKDKTSTSNKVKKAKDLGINLLSIDEFYDIINK